MSKFCGSKQIGIKANKRGDDQKRELMEDAKKTTGRQNYKTKARNRSKREKKHVL